MSLEAPPIGQEERERERNRAVALAWVQEMGFEGQELPKGRPGGSGSCVLALALGGRVGYERWRPEPETEPGRIVSLPWRVVQFREDFDARLHPDLIEET